MDKINLVWLKRDIRTQDHEPLHLAEQHNLPYLILFIFEPLIIQYPDASPRHLQFQYHCIKEMNETLYSFGHKVHVFYGDAIHIFEFLTQKYEVKNIFSYQETGLNHTFERDKKLKLFFQSKGIQWQEIQKAGVQRGSLYVREKWQENFQGYVDKPAINNTFSSEKTILLTHNPFELPFYLQNNLQNYPSQYQPAGEKYAWKYLTTFVKERGIKYMQSISKPQESRYHSSRLSPYLAWGSLSIRQVYQTVIQSENYVRYPRSYEAFISRLWWQSYFIQKLEKKPNYETNCIQPAFEDIPFGQDEVKLNAWKKGKTGIPLIDACMRCLHSTGWINFRMRAMLVSFLCHYLEIDWKLGMYHLAQLFLDYEPGIHYPQFQMQAGVSGNPIIRAYNPIKQSKEKDPDAIFIKKWLPELSLLPKELIHEPWKISSIEAKMYNFSLEKDYCNPIIIPEKADFTLLKKLWKIKKLIKSNKPEIKQE